MTGTRDPNLSVPSCAPLRTCSHWRTFSGAVGPSEAWAAMSFPTAYPMFTLGCSHEEAIAAHRQ